LGYGMTCSVSFLAKVHKGEGRGNEKRKRGKKEKRGEMGEAWPWLLPNHLTSVEGGGEGGRGNLRGKKKKERRRGKNN